MQELFENGRLVWRLIQDSRVPSWIKVGIPLVVALYFFSPVDVIPDFLLGLGQLDDIGVILLGMSLIVRFAPRHVVEEHKRALGYSLDADESAGGRTSGGEQYWSAPGGRGTVGNRDADAERAGTTIEGDYRVIPPDSQ